METLDHLPRSTTALTLRPEEEAINANIDSWTGFEAAHIFPVAHEGHWKQHNFDRWITKPSVNGGSINSVQNGLLLRSDIHGLFDTYEVSINPDVCNLF